MEDGSYRTESKAPRLAAYNIKSKKVDPVAFDNLDEMMYPEDFGLTDPVGFWVLNVMEDEKWVYYCNADSRSMFLYKAVPENIKKCSYVETKKYRMEWKDAELVCK